MTRELTACQMIERSVQKKYRKRLWSPFTLAVKRYRLIGAGERVAVCVSGGRDSFLLAVLVRLLARYSDVPFKARYIALDDGFAPDARERLEANAALLGIPLEIYGYGAGHAASGRVRRLDLLYERAARLGCGKIALGQHFSDVVGDVVASMLYGARLEAMPPKARSRRFEGMELIRPMYCVHGDDIAAWVRYNRLDFGPPDAGPARRVAAERLLRELRRANPDVEKSVFGAIHSVCLETFPGWRAQGVGHLFTEEYGLGQTPNDCFT